MIASWITCEVTCDSGGEGGGLGVGRRLCVLIDLWVGGIGVWRRCGRGNV